MARWLKHLSQVFTETEITVAPCILMSCCRNCTGQIKKEFRTEIQYFHSSILSLWLRYPCYLPLKAAFLIARSRHLESDGRWYCFESTSKAFEFYLSYQGSASEVLLEQSHFVLHIKKALPFCTHNLSLSDGSLSIQRTSVV